jgi:uncharacterized protein with PIN domain
MSDKQENGGRKLVCDAMLGKLSRELRALGMDVEYRRGMSGMRGYKSARSKGKLFLSRNTKLRELEGVLFVEDNDPAMQLEQVRKEFKLGPSKASEPDEKPSGRRGGRQAKPQKQEESGARCRDCNVPLEKISRDQARPSIPFFIYQIHHDFRRCPKCKKVFWPGSHTQEPARGQGGSRSPGRPRGRRGGRQQRANKPS